MHCYPKSSFQLCHFDGLYRIIIWIIRDKKIRDQMGQNVASYDFKDRRFLQSDILWLNNSAIIVPQIHWWVFVPKRPSWSPDWCHGNIACFLGSVLSSLLFLCPSMFLSDKLPWGLNAVTNYQPNPRNSQGWWMPFQQYQAIFTAINFRSSHYYENMIGYIWFSKN